MQSLKTLALFFCLIAGMGLVGPVCPTTSDAAEPKRLSFIGKKSEDLEKVAGKPTDIKSPGCGANRKYEDGKPTKSFRGDVWGYKTETSEGINYSSFCIIQGIVVAEKFATQADKDGIAVYKSEEFWGAEIIRNLADQEPQTKELEF